MAESYKLINEVKNNNIEEVRKLVKEKQIDINIQDNKGYTALHYASEKGYLEVVTLLLQYNANVAQKTLDGKETPLHLAAINGHFDIVCEIAINSNTTKDDLNLGDSFDNTVLHLITQYEPYIPDNNNHLILNYTMEKRYGEIVANNTNNDEIAKENSDSEDYKIKSQKAINILLNKGANPNQQNKSDNTPLHTAVLYYNVPAVEILLKNDADPNILNNQHEHPLHTLLSNIKDNNKTRENQDSILKLVKLLATKSKINNISENKNTPLLSVIEETDTTVLSNDILLGIVEILIENQANVTAIDAENNTALHLSVKNNNYELTELLLKNGAFTIINVKGKYCYTPIHWAALNDDAEIIRTLLRNNADISMLNEENETPLQLAVKNNCLKAANLLIQATLLKDKIKPDYIKNNDKISKYWDKCVNKLNLYKMNNIQLSQNTYLALIEKIKNIDIDIKQTIKDIEQAKKEYESFPVFEDHIFYKLYCEILINHIAISIEKNNFTNDNNKDINISFSYFNPEKKEIINNKNSMYLTSVIKNILNNLDYYSFSSFIEALYLTPSHVNEVWKSEKNTKPNHQTIDSIEKNSTNDNTQTTNIPNTHYNNAKVYSTTFPISKWTPQRG